MIHDRRDRIDLFLLRPLGMTFLISGCSSAFNGKWFDAVVFLIAGFFGVVAVYLGLLPDRSREETAHPGGAPATKMDDENPIIFALIARTMFRLSFLLATMFTMLAWHSGAPWLRLIVGGISIYFGVIISFIFIVGYPFHIRKKTA